MKFLKTLLLFFLMCSSSFAKQNNILNVRLNTAENQERIVIETDNKVNFNAFVLNKPSRLVIDLQNTSQNIKAPNFKANDVVDSIRIGKYSETDARLVFDLNTPSKIVKSFYLKPDNNKTIHRIVVDLEYDKKELQKIDLIGKLIDENVINVPNSDLASDSKNLNSIVDEILADSSAAPKNLYVKKTAQESQPQNLNYNIKRKPRIIIDAGHGGKDPGAIGRKGTKEKILTLVYAKSLKAELDKTGKYKTYLTREQDVYVDLRQRVSIARRYKGDLFISIHADSSPNRNARGLSIYTLSQYASDTRTAELAKKENKADIIGGLNLYGEYQDTINTLVDISRSKAMSDSQRFSSILANRMGRRELTSLGETKKHGNFAVLTSADMPSILLEIGFLSNARDERMIRSFGYKSKIVSSLVDSINLYFGL